jgi:hypothetical protein
MSSPSLRGSVNSSALILTALVFWVFFLSTGSRAEDTSVGPYKQKCSHISTDSHGNLSATCEDFFGKPAKVLLKSSQLAECPKQSLPGGPKGEVWNVDGHLKCVLSSTKSPNGRGDLFDIISLSETDDTSAKTIRWHIDHPNVSKARTKYSGIVFHQGDDIKVDAGGCVRTNGGTEGQRWKQYVNPYINPQQESRPSLPNLYDAVYAGGLEIADERDSTTLRNEPFDVALPLQLPGGFTVPGTGSTTYPKQFVLSLLYYDDTFNENGYYAHDDGTNQQCKNDGPAWVGVTIVRPQEPIPYSQFEQGKNFDLVWRMDDKGIDGNGLPLNPLWSYQIQHPGQVPDYKPSCVCNTTQHPGYVMRMDCPKCTSQPTQKDVVKNGLETFGLCQPDNVVWPGHINWQVATYQGGLFFRGWSGNGVDGDDDINFGLETNDQSGETKLSDASDAGIGLEFKNSETAANYNAPFWSAFEQNATSQGQLISVNGNNPKEFADGEIGVVIGLVGIDAVHGGYSEIHPVYAMAIEVAWSSDSNGGKDETWAFFIRNQGNEGTCSHLTHYWQSKLGNSMYEIQLPWPEGATDVKVVTTPYTKLETSSPEQKYLGMQGTKPWTYLRFRLPSNTAIGIDGEITIHYDGVVSKGTPQVHHRARGVKAEHDAGTSKESALGIDWSALSSRITDSAVREKFLNEANAIIRANASPQAKTFTFMSIDEKQTTFIHNQDVGVWIGKPATDVAEPDTERANQIAAIKALLVKYSKYLDLPITVGKQQ